MDDAVAILRELRAEYEQASEEMYRSERYYEDLRSKIAAIDEAIGRLDDR